MAASTAVVTSTVYSVPEVTGDAARLHDPHDVDAHVQSIERLLRQELERKQLAVRAAERERIHLTAVGDRDQIGLRVGPG